MARRRGVSFGDSMDAVARAIAQASGSVQGRSVRAVSDANRESRRRADASRSAATASRVRSAGRAASTSGNTTSGEASAAVNSSRRRPPRPGSADANARNAAQAIALAIRNSPTGAAKPKRGTFREKVAQETNRGIVQGDRAADNVDKKDLAFAVKKFMRTHKWAREAGKDSQAVKDAAAYLVNKGHKQYRRK